MSIQYIKYQNGLPHECGSPILYNETYDSLYCPECNIWLEKVCEDSECFFCPKRPKFPC